MILPPNPYEMWKMEEIKQLALIQRIQILTCQSIYGLDDSLQAATLSGLMSI